MYNKEFFDSLSKIILIKGTKNKPTHKFSKEKNTHNDKSVESILKKGYNVAIRTGKTNNLTVVDLDVHKPGFKFDFDIDELCKKTYWQKSASGGIHLFYQYDNDIKQGQNPKIQVDTRNEENGYIIFDGSKYKDKKYEGQNDLIPSKIPEDVKNFLLDNGYDKNDFATKEKKTDSNNITVKDTSITKDKNLYIPKSHLKQILDEKPLSFYNNIEFWKFTTVMKFLDAYDLWDNFNKKRDKYDLNENIKIWNSVNADKCNIKLLIDLFNPDISGYYNLKYLPEFKLDSLKINKSKLGYDFIQKNTNYIIKSDTGTGKTTSVKYFLHKTQDKFISIVSRRSLGQEQYNNFNTDNFLTCNYYEYVDKIKNGDNIIIQLDSILRIGININLSKYILILDEFESIIHYLFTSSTLKTKRVLIFIRFIELLKGCKNFICIDADITNKSTEFIATFINEMKLKKKIKTEKDLLFEKIKKEEIKQKEDSLQKKIEKIHILEEQIKTQILEINNLEKEIKQKDDSLQKKIEKIHILHEQIIPQLLEFDNLEEQIETQLLEFDNLKKEIKTEKDLLQKKEEKIHILEEQIKPQRLENKNLKKEIYNLKKEIDNLEKEIKQENPDEFEYIPRKYELIENEYKHNKGINAYEIQTEDLLIEKLKGEKKFLCCCDSKGVAEEIESKLYDNAIDIIMKDIDEYITTSDFEIEDDKILDSELYFKHIRGMNIKIYEYLKSFKPFEIINKILENHLDCDFNNIVFYGDILYDNIMYNTLDDKINNIVKESIDSLDDDIDIYNNIKDHYDEIVNIIIDTLRKKRVICITSDTDEYYNFDEHDRIIYSPKIIYGIDSSIKRPVYCFYKEHTINTKQMVQQIARCRNISNLYYHFVKKTYNHNDITYEQVLEINTNIINYGICNDNKLLETNFRMIDEYLEKDYIKLFSKFEYEEICYNTNKFCHFIKLLDERGFNLKTYRMLKIKKINDYILPIEDEKNETDEEKLNKANKYTKDYFSKQKNKNILEIIGLELDKHFDTIRDNMEIITSYNFIQEYYNIKKYFYDDINDYKLVDKINNQNEFIVNKVSNDNQKIRLLLKFKQMIGCKEKNKLESTILLNEEQIDNFKYEYKMIFLKNKYYNEKFKFDTFYDQDKILNKLYKKTFTPYIIKAEKERVNGKQRYMYYLNNTEYNKFKNLIDLRKENVIKQEYYKKVEDNINKNKWPEFLKNNFNLF